MRHVNPPEPDHLMIHEVYDDHGWTQDGARVGGESIEELREQLMLMRRALNEPVLDYDPAAPVEPGGG